MANATTYNDFWISVLSQKDAEGVCVEFELDPSDRRGLDEWLSEAEHSAQQQGLELSDELRAEYHSRALEELCAVADD